MKTNKLRTTAFLLLFMFIFSCQKENSPQKAKDEIDYNEIGIKHNQSLEIAFNSLKTSHSKGAFSKEEYFDIVGKTTIAFFEKNNTNISEKQLNKVKNDISQFKKFFIEYSRSVKKGDPELYLNLISISDSLMTEKQKVMSKKIFSILLEKNNNIDTIQQKLDSLEETIKLTCSESEKPSLLTGISIARHSSLYWHDNYSKWEELGFSKNEAGPINWEVVAIVDAVVAIYEAIVCSPAVLVEWIGWAAYIENIVIVSGVCSAMTALVYLLFIE
jgi:hypothetical protein